jgi:hypothetical protein
MISSGSTIMIVVIKYIDINRTPRNETKRVDKP